MKTMYRLLQILVDKLRIMHSLFFKNVNVANNILKGYYFIQLRRFTLLNVNIYNKNIFLIIQGVLQYLPILRERVHTKAYDCILRG